MPHGSGHHGGGGFHGGGHHGGGHHGGWGHHHHHHGGFGHHHHHHHYGRPWGWGWGWGWGTYGYSGYRYHRRRFYRGWGWGIAALSIITFIIVLSIVLSVRYSDDKRSSYNYAPGDTRTISYSSTYCDGLTISGDTGATLYLLDSKPPLSGPVNNFTARPPKVIEADTYHYLKYHLFTGSKLNMTYCLDESSSSPAVSFFLIKGNDNWDRWEDDGSSSHSKFYISINNLCSGGNNTRPYIFTSTDYYYFAFDNLSPRTDLKIKASLFLQRVEYVVTNVSIADSCSIGGSVDRCTVSVPYQSDYTALLKVDNGQIAEENLDIDWSCDPRVWVYVLIVVIPLLFVVAALFSICVLCICYARRRQAGYSTVTEPPEAQPEAVTVTTTAIPSAPPPVNPNYGAPPPVYGSTHFNTASDTPPDYKTAVNM